MSRKSASRKFWFLTVLCLTMLIVSASYLMSAQNRPINYKLVPNLQAMKDRSPAPQFTLPNLEGGEIGLRDFRGKLLMLNFWASWCVPCREEMPAMERLYQKYRNQGFVILGINLQDNKKNAVAFVKELRITFPVAFDPNGEVGRLYGAWGLPATYLIDGNGIALARAWGPIDWFTPGARELVEMILEQPK